VPAGQLLETDWKAPVASVRRKVGRKHPQQNSCKWIRRTSWFICGVLLPVWTGIHWQRARKGSCQWAFGADVRGTRIPVGISENFQPTLNPEDLLKFRPDFRNSLARLPGSGNARGILDEDAPGHNSDRNPKKAIVKQ